MMLNGYQNSLLSFGAGTCLAELDSSSLEAVMQAARKRSFEKGQIICLEGAPCPGLIIIEAGWLDSVKISPQGREQVIHTAGPGEMINEISMMSGENNNLLTVRTLEPSSIWLIDRVAFSSLTTRHPNLSRIMTQNLAKRMVQLVNLVEDLALRNVEGRLANLLLNQSTGSAEPACHFPTRAEIAARIGTTSVVISRLLHEMEDQGAIRLGHRAINVVDPHLLETMAFQEYK